MSAANLRSIRILVASFLIMFGLANQVARIAYDMAEPLTFPLLPAGTILPGAFLVIAGLACLFNREWGMTLGAVLCLIHLTMSLIFFVNTSRSVATLHGAMEVVYVVFCAAGGFGSWWILHQTRRQPSQA